MSSTHVPPYGRPPLRAVQVLGGGSAGSSAHVRSIAGGLVERGVQVTVCAPAGLERAYGFGDTGASFLPVPRSGDPAALAALRSACAGADVVHAHGLNAALRTALALSGHRLPMVVTWYTRSHTEGVRRHLKQLMERRAVRAAAVVLATSSDLVDRARSRGARDARLTPVTVPVPRTLPGRDGRDGRGESKVRAELGAVGRPLLMAAGSLTPDRGYRTLLDAARLWQRLDPVPLLVIVGEGPDRAALQRRIETESPAVRLIGADDDVSELIAAADLAVLPSRWEGRSPLAQEALRLGVPLVATAVGGTPELVGDAAELVPYGDPAALAGRVAALLADPARRRLLADAGRAQAASWPTEDETVAQVLSVYDELTQPVPTR